MVAVRGVFWWARSELYLMLTQITLNAKKQFRKRIAAVKRLALENPATNIRKDFAEGYLQYWAETAVKGVRKTLATIYLHLFSFGPCT